MKRYRQWRGAEAIIAGHVWQVLDVRLSGGTLNIDVRCKMITRPIPAGVYRVQVFGVDGVRVISYPNNFYTDLEPGRGATTTLVIVLHEDVTVA